MRVVNPSRKGNQSWVWLLWFEYNQSQLQKFGSNGQFDLLMTS